MSSITWKALIKGLKKLASMPRSAAFNLAGIDLACGILNCTPRELDLLSSAIAENTYWITSNHREDALTRACSNKRLLQIMKTLFVEDKVRDLVYTSSESVIRKHIKLRGPGLAWDGTSRIVRIRRNGIMNWGTTNTNLGTDYVGDVLLVPVADITHNAILFAGPKLYTDCENYLYVWMQLGFNKFGAIDFWGDLYALCTAIRTMSSEYECLTYGMRVPCNVFRLNGSKSGKLAKIPRTAVSKLLKLQDTANS